MNRFTYELNGQFYLRSFVDNKELFSKIGQLEDVLEKYNLDSADELDKDLKMSHRIAYEIGQIEDDLPAFNGLKHFFAIIDIMEDDELHFTYKGKSFVLKRE